MYYFKQIEWKANLDQSTESQFIPGTHIQMY